MSIAKLRSNEGVTEATLFSPIHAAMSHAGVRKRSEEKVAPRLGGGHGAVGAT